jgi:holo-[acyl-carrier protein] synthase
MKMRAVMKTHDFSIGEAKWAALPAARGLRIGVDIVQISAIEASLAAFGGRFVSRLFSEREAAYAMASPAQSTQRLAARFAAKEAAIKAFDLAEAGIDWREIEVERSGDGACSLKLHARAAQAAGHLDGTPIALRLSHHGDYATAFVVAPAAG